MAEKINLPPDLQGVLVNTIVREGTADKAGVNESITKRHDEMEKGDIITAIDGHEITGNEEMISYLL